MRKRKSRNMDKKKTFTNYSINLKNYRIMATQSVRQEYVPSEKTMEKFNALPWRAIEESFGLKPETFLDMNNDKLKKRFMEALAYGRYTPKLTVKIPIAGTGKYVYPTVSLRVYQKEDQKYDFELSTYQPALKKDTDKRYVYGEQLEQNVVRNLRLTGNGGEIVLLPNKDGEVKEKLVSINPETNDICVVDAALPKSILSSDKFKGIYGVMPDKVQTAYLCRGKAVKMEGLQIPGCDGPQTRYIQFDAFTCNFGTVQTVDYAARQEFMMQKALEKATKELEQNREQRKEQGQGQSQSQSREQEQDRGQEVESGKSPEDMDMPADLEERF